MRLSTIVQSELPLVDREDELSFLKGLLDQAAAGKGQVVFVGGEAGIGKTRLIQELGRHARANGAIFAIGPSYEEEHSIPYSPWTEAIRSVVQQRRTKTFDKSLGRTLAEVGRLVPELESRANELGIKGWLSGPRESFMPITATDAERVRLFQAITDLLISISQEKPLIIFLDDLLWADDASLQLLHYFIRRTRDHRILIATTYRDTELPEDHPLSRLILDLNRERTLRRIHLDRLTTNHVAQLISNQLGGGTTSPDFAKLVHSRTGGNPFFVEEVIRSLSEDIGIIRSSAGWTLRETQGVQIPSTVRALIKQRISRLGEDTAQTLMIGAAIGMEYDYEILKKTTGLSEEQLITQLEAALQAGLVREARPGKKISYVFSDEQIRDFLYDELSLIRKRKTHARIALAMEEHYSKERESHYEELAHHYIHAGETSKAAEYSRLAGDRAASLHASADARKHYKNELELLEPSQKLERTEVYTKIGDASNQLGEYKECVKNYHQAISLARDSRDNRKLAQLHLKLGYAHYVGADMEKALAALKEGLSLLEGMPTTHEEAAISQNIARLLLNTGERDEGLRWCKKAIQLARELDDKEVLAHSLISLAYGTKPTRENKAEVFQHDQEALKIATENNLDEAACRALLNFGGGIARLKASYAEAVEIFKRGIEYARKDGQLAYEAWLEAEIAFLALIPLGELHAAVDAADRAHKIGAEISELFTAYSILPLGLVQLYRGNLARAEVHLAKGLPQAENARNSLVLFYYYWAQGELYLKKNDPATAREYFLKSAKIGLNGVWTYPPLDAYFGLLKVSLAEKKIEEAASFRAKISEGASELDEAWGYAYEQWSTGLIAEAQGDSKKAAEALRASSDAWNKLKNRPNYAETLLDLGRTMIESSEAKERAATIEEAKRIIASFGTQAF